MPPSSVWTDTEDGAKWSKRHYNHKTTTWMNSSFIELDIWRLRVGCEDVVWVNVAVEDREPLLGTNNCRDIAIKLHVYFCLYFFQCSIIRKCVWSIGSCSYKMNISRLIWIFLRLINFGEINEEGKLFAWQIGTIEPFDNAFLYLIHKTWVCRIYLHVVKS
jgi:hypothetical protein